MFTPKAKHRIAVASAALTLSTVLAACSSSSGTSNAPSPATTGIHLTTTSVGSILVDCAGRTMYVFAADSVRHSVCSGGCLTAWTAVPADTSHGATSVGSVTLGTLTRSDGTKQLTVNGLPAYYYVSDTSPGKTSGQGISS
jgi:predicted lipoprotein with Yx(FWY)xxD motif